MTETFKRWHDFVAAPDPAILSVILAEDIRFHSPFLWKPKEGRATAVAILMTVTGVFRNFRYVREIIDGSNWCLEFEATVDGLSLRGVDLIRLNDDGRIVDFEVMIRPANALQAIGAEMGRRLAADQSSTER
jgi:hypothetical protein